MKVFSRLLTVAALLTSLSSLLFQSDSELGYACQGYVWGSLLKALNEGVFMIINSYGLLSSSGSQELIQSDSELGYACQGYVWGSLLKGI
ncbi:hypothetical protein CDAR_229801 [Caerostris darwini]|uniref:Uncharacterized protein n=1 Tax=Caerostris darwini TaxID=1538125 RepID=A0AAV4PYH5_9ARAC|nr:hypothetical protein CDAR_229801 [Caerostris darwini]